MYRVLYTAAVYALLPVAMVRLLLRSSRAPAYRQRWEERLGRFEPPAKPGGLWIHAVSVGEVQAIAPVVRHVLAGRPDLPVTITTTTPTGSDRVRLLFGEGVFHVYCPYDVPFAVAGFLERVRPVALLMVETEIWPNLLAACRRRGIRTLLANARLSERSARRYRRLGGFARQTFGQIDRVAAQAPADAERFIALGMPAQRVCVTGSVKFDLDVPASVREQAQALRQAIGSGRPVWIAASTHEGEDEPVLEAHAVVRETLPDALLILVPRHPERFERVAVLCERKGFVVASRSAGQAPRRETAVLLGDTMGELIMLLGASDAAFIGGSLMPVGGHNMLEAAAQGVALAFGPHTFNFAAIADLLMQEGAAARVQNARELAALMTRWLADASERAAYGENGRRVVDENRGALPALLAELDAVL
jgi:3-deoxy-D-manno-octulosonic-acid transferase